jgi:hypothetical protein
MKSGVGWKILAISLALVCIAPASAVAKRGYFTIDPSSRTQAQLRGSNGYGISLSANGGFVSLTAQGHHATVQYAARGAASKGKIKARFGSLGRVGLRFHPHGKARLFNEPAGNCRGGDSLIQPGVFVGKLDFEGEQGYTRIHANRVKGTVTHTRRQVCKHSGGDEGGKGPLSSLKWTLLSATAEENKVSFNAFKTELKSKPGVNGTSFSATIIESIQRGFAVFRSIEATAGLTAFSVVSSHDRVDEATVTPPPPFSGSATYRRAVAKKSETWLGSLAGDFPGLGTVSLAGPEFCAEGVLFKGCNGSAAWLVNLSG